MAVVHLRDACFAYGDRRVLDRISLRLDPGERVAVIGANGAGKTTLLKLIGGLLRAGSGSVQIDGIDVAAIPRRQIRRQIRAVAQELVIPFSFTVREMVNEPGPRISVCLVGSTRSTAPPSTMHCE